MADDVLYYMLGSIFTGLVPVELWDTRVLRPQYSRSQVI